MRPVVIIGAGGFAREVLDVIDAASQDEPQYEVLGYTVDPQYGSPGTVINGAAGAMGAGAFALSWLPVPQPAVLLLI